MHLYVRRKLIEQRLRRALGRSFDVINAPDHPLLIRGPDLLVAREGASTAIVCSTDAERRRPHELHQRMLLVRSALPPETAIVFVSCAGEHVARGLFDAISPFEELDDLPGLIEAIVRKGEDRDRSGRESIAKRFGATYLLSRTLYRRESPPRAVRGANRARRTLVDQIQTVEFSTFDQDPSSFDLGRLVLDGAEEFFQADNGDIFPTNRTPRAIFVGALPYAPGDPEKFIRAAAFAGWLVAPKTSFNERDRIAYLLEKHAR